MSDSKSKAKAKALVAASKSHKEAEKRRRDRINAHYATLLTLLPNSIKTHKASILTATIQHVTEQKKRIAEMAAHNGGWTEDCSFPGDTNEVEVGYCEGESGVVKATVCCEDRKELMLDLTRALKTVKAKVVRAEMGTIGGRTKSVIWLQGLAGGSDGSGGGSHGGGVDVLGTLRRALKVVIHNPNISKVRHGDKRTRVSY